MIKSIANFSGVFSYPYGTIELLVKYTHMKTAILIRGASASGKTTTTRKLLERLPEFRNIHIDNYINELPQELTHQEKREIAYKKGLQDLEKAVSEGVSVIIDELFRPEFYSAVTEMLQKAEYQILNIRLKVDLELLKERDLSRSIQVGDERLETLAKRSEIIEEQLADIKKGDEIIIDSSNTTLDSAVEQILKKLTSYSEDSENLGETKSMN